MNRLYLKYGIFIACILFVSIFIVHDALAIAYSGFGGRPAYPREDNPRTNDIFVHTLEPDTVQEEGVMVLNRSEEEKTLLVYAADSTPSTDGGFACRQLTEPKEGVGAWIAFEDSREYELNENVVEVTLLANTNLLVPFTISVPTEASVGEQDGCILIQEKKEDDSGAESGINISTRTGLRVAITVPGEITRGLEIVDLEILPREQGGRILKPTVRNTGNVSIDAEMKLVTTDIFNNVVAEHGGDYPILRGETSSWNFELAPRFWGGWYTIRLEVIYDANLEASTGIDSGKPKTTLDLEKKYFIFSGDNRGIAIEVGIILLVIVCIILLVIYRIRKKLIKTTWIDYEVKEGDDIKKLSSKYNVSWKLLVRVNKLEPPYILKPGDKIKVPPEVK